MDASLSNVVGPIISKLVDLAITPIGRQFGYMCYYSSNLENLREGVEALRGTKSRVGDLVAGAERKGNLVHDEVRNWLTAVTELNERVESLFDQQVRCLDLKSRFRMSKKAYKMKMNNVDKLQTKGEKFTEDNVSCTATPPPYSAIFSGDAVPLGSRDSIMEKILEALKKDDVKVLGLYGMGGVGKTTLIQEVAKRAEAMNLFDEILMAVVSQDPSIRKIQDQFASKLGLSLGDDKESDTVRAGRLHEKLDKTGKVLVILDDLWKHLDLQAVGIPSPDKHKCCKIVMTTREKDVCDQMDCKNNTFSVVVLSEEEGWHLFKKMAGDCVTSAEVEPVAIEVAKECDGLPLAIVVVARALKDKNPTRWKDALRQLRASAPTNIKGMHKDVFSRLQLSYDYLDGEEIKQFFLLSSLFPEDNVIPIEWQKRYGMGLGLFHQAGLGGTIQEAREKADSFIDILKSACLLLDGDEDGTIRVHDVVRDFCVSAIASKGQQHVFLVKSGWELTEWPQIDCYYTAVSLDCNNIKQFPRGLNCPKLKCLLFTGIRQEVNIADSFFETMKELEVLDISAVHIPLFPPSLGLLGKLRTLCLDVCILGEMEIIGNLKGLEVLSLCGSRFKDNKLPVGISQLTRLRLLDLSNCSNLLIPCGILSNLSRLEELYLENSFDEWEKESEEEFYIENSGRRERYASLSELKSSSHSLTTLKGMHVRDVRLFPKDLFFSKLTTFQIQISDDLVDYENYSRLKAGLKVEFKGSSIAKDHGICSLMKRGDYLQLSQMGNMKRILYDFVRDLKTLVVEKSDNIEEIIISEEGEAVFPQLKFLVLSRLPKLARFCNVRQSRKPVQSQSLFTDEVVFPCLERLILDKLDVVVNIWHPELSNQNFLPLKELTVSGCNSLTSLFQLAIAKHLVNMEKLKVESCVEMKEIVGEEDEEETEKVIVFPNVWRLELNYLPKITSFRKGDHQLKWQNCQNVPSKKSTGGTESIAITSQNDLGCSRFQRLFNNKVAFPSLTDMSLVGLKGIKQIWGSQFPMESFPQLRELSLYRCDALEAVIGKQEEEEEEVVEAKLHRQHQLENIRASNFPFLWFTGVEVCFCKNVLKIIPAYMHPRLQKLQSLTVGFCNSVEEIFEQPDHSTATAGGPYLYPHLASLQLMKLPKLTHAPLNAFLNLESLTKLSIGSCNSLTSLFQPSIAKRLVNLEELVVVSCKEMKEIVGEEEEESEKVIVFPKVKRLDLHKLPKLICFRKQDYMLKWQKGQKTASKNKGGGAEPRAPTSRNNLCSPCFQPLFDHQVAFPSLTIMILFGLKGIKQIWGSRFPVESFLQLRELEVWECNALEAVIGKQGEEEISRGKLVIPQLKILRLVRLQNIRCFYENNLYTLEFPSLDFVRLDECPKMTTFSYASATTPKLQQILMGIGFGYIQMSKGINTIVKNIFLEQVEKEEMVSTSKEEEEEEMVSTSGEEEGEEKVVEEKLHRQHQVENIWPSNFPFRSYTRVEVCFCKNVLKIIPVYMHPRLQKLQSLKVCCCNSVEEIFEQPDHSTATVGGPYLYPHLTFLQLMKLPKLTHAPLNAFLNLESLTQLCLGSCNSLTSLFQPSIAKRLVNLEELVVESCKEMKEIVGEEEEESEKVIVFAKMKTLKLHRLPKLTGFRKQDHQLKWQKCENATSKDKGGGAEPIAPTSQNNLCRPCFQPLFDHQVAFPFLTEMSLIGLEGIKHVWGSQFRMESFPQLRELNVWSCNALEAVIGKQGEEEISRGNLVFPQLKTLGLEDLQNIRCFCENNLYTLEFPSLDDMTLAMCPRMTTFSYASATTPILQKIVLGFGFGCILMNKDINTIVRDIFLVQVEEDEMVSSSKEEEEEEMASPSEGEEGEEKLFV